MSRTAVNHNWMLYTIKTQQGIINKAELNVAFIRLVLVRDVEKVIYHIYCNHFVERVTSKVKCS